MALWRTFPLLPRWTDYAALIRAHVIMGPGDAAKAENLRGPGAYWTFEGAYTPTTMSEALTLRAFFHGLFGAGRPFLLRMPGATGTTPPGSACALRTDGTAEHTDCTDFTDGTAYADSVAASVTATGATTAAAAADALSIVIDAAVPAPMLVVGNYMMLGDVHADGQLVQIVSVAGGTIGIRPRLRAPLAIGSAVECGPVSARFVLNGDPPEVPLVNGRGKAFNVSFREDY